LSSEAHFAAAPNMRNKECSRPRRPLANTTGRSCFPILHSIARANVNFKGAGRRARASAPPPLKFLPLSLVPDALSPHFCKLKLEGILVGCLVPGACMTEGLPGLPSTLGYFPGALCVLCVFADLTVNARRAARFTWITHACGGSQASRPRCPCTRLRRAGPCI
jgi:hypothetical protein